MVSNDIISRKIKVVSKGDGTFIVVESNITDMPTGKPITTNVLAEAMSNGILIETIKDTPETGHHGSILKG